MALGAFSISLPVKNLAASKTFYEALGFSVFGGAMEQNYLIMKNGNALIGLFQGMFEQPMLTFNPGWDEQCNEVNPFDDVRAIQARIQAAGIVPGRAADAAGSGPDYLTLKDPDGFDILIDQHR